MRSIGHFIGGKEVKGTSGRTADVFEPMTGDVQAKVALASKAEVRAAVENARAAQGEWAATNPQRRARVMMKFVELVQRDYDKLAELLAREHGKTVPDAKGDIQRGLEVAEFACGIPHLMKGEYTEGAGPGIDIYSMRQPLGVVAGITPFNFPAMIPMWKFAPAIACGNAFILKPSERDPGVPMALAQLMIEAGLPAGILNVVNGDKEAVDAILDDPDVKAIGFVGESATGSAIMAQGAPTLKRVHFELGGKNPVIVFDDADLDRALDAVVFMIYSLNGERCTSSSRLLVQESIAGKFVEKLTARVKALKVGHPLDPATEIGPLIHERHLAKVCSYFDVAKKDGATIAVGGKPHDGPGGGHYVQPTLVTGANANMRVAQEEVFGPFLTVIPFKDEREAIEIANGVQYGLTGYVWTGEMGRALRVADALEAGMIWLNSENVRHLPTPFGGMKSSGIGRDGGDYSFDFYMETKHVSLARGTHKIQKLGI